MKQPLKPRVRARRRRLPDWLDRLVSVGIRSQDPEVRQRQRFVNAGVAVAILNNLGHTLFNGLYDFAGLANINLYNLIVSALIALTPLWNRVGDVAGAVYLVGLIALGNIYVVVAIGSGGGALVYYTLAGAMFVVFGVRHWRIYAFFVAVAVAAIVLSTAFVPPEGPVLAGDAEFRRSFSGQILINVLILNSVMIVYAMWARWRAERELSVAHEQSRSLVARTLPAAVARRLQAQPDRRIADGYERLTVLVAQLDHFADATRDFGPRETVDYLDRLYSDFDRLVVRFGADKIRAVGERYLAAGGLDRDAVRGAAATGGLALEMLESMAQRARSTGYAVNLRIGIETAEAVAGVIGRERLSFDVWGRAVDSAQELSMQAQANRIAVGAGFAELTGHVFTFEEAETDSGQTHKVLTGLQPVEEPDLPPVDDEEDLF